jgi:hypothetical protein
MGFGRATQQRRRFSQPGEGKPVIWLLPSGVHFQQHVWVRDTTSGDRLIIVAGTSSDTTFKFKLGTNLGMVPGGIDARFRSTWSRAVRFRSTAMAIGTRRRIGLRSRLDLRRWQRSPARFAGRGLA